MDSINFTLSDDHQMIVDVSQNIVNRLKPKQNEYLKLIFEEQTFPEEVWEAMAQAGIFSGIIPEAYGGTGMGLLSMVLATEIFSRAALTNALAILTTMDAMVILTGGTEAQKQHWLPRIAEGSIKMAFAITEPDSGTNAFRMRTFARREHDVYKLNGQKAWITGADVADYIMVVARTIPHDEIKAQGQHRTHGINLFIIDAKAPGLTLNKMDTMGIEGFKQFFLFFDDVEVPVENRIGPEHQGFGALFAALNPERILVGAVGVGMADFALEKAVAYAKERVVWGKSPIAAYQGVQHPLARIKMNQEAARLMTYRAAWAFDQGVSHEEIGQYANMAKYLASEMLVEAFDRAIQTHGGNGFVQEYHLINLWAPARLLKTAPINNEMILNYVAENMLGLPRSY